MYTLTLFLFGCTTTTNVSDIPNANIDGTIFVPQDLPECSRIEKSIAGCVLVPDPATFEGWANFSGTVISSQTLIEPVNCTNLGIDGWSNGLGYFFPDTPHLRFDVLDENEQIWTLFIQGVPDLAVQIDEWLDIRIGIDEGYWSYSSEFFALDADGRLRFLVSDSGTHQVGRVDASFGDSLCTHNEADLILGHPDLIVQVGDERVVVPKGQSSTIQNYTILHEEIEQLEEVTEEAEGTDWGPAGYAYYAIFTTSPSVQ